MFTSSVTRSDINNGDNVSVSLTGTATNPYDPTGVTSIDYEFQLTIVPGQDGTPTVTVTGSHDGFPAYEINVTASNGKTYQVYYNVPASKWDVLELRPPKDVRVEEEKK